MDRGFKEARGGIKLGARPVDIKIHASPRQPLVPQPPEPLPIIKTALTQLENKPIALPTIPVFVSTVKTSPIKQYVSPKKIVPKPTPITTTPIQSKPIIKSAPDVPALPKIMDLPADDLEDAFIKPPLPANVKIKTGKKLKPQKIAKKSRSERRTIRLEKRISHILDKIESPYHTPKDKVRLLVANASKKSKNLFGKNIVRKVSIGFVLLAVIVVTGYTSFDTWQTNNQLKQALAKNSATANEIASNKTTSSNQNAQQSDSNVLGDSTSSVSLADYKVAPDLPRAIYIDKIGVAAKILPMGVNTDNTLQSPETASDVGWYSGSAKPGKPGAMLFDGHSSETGTHYGIFGNLISLVTGDHITIEKGDGTKITYKVASTKIISVADFKMNEMMTPYGGAAQGLNIITCTGKWTADGKTLDQRLLVFAVSS